MLAAVCQLAAKIDLSQQKWMVMVHVLVQKQAVRQGQGQEQGQLVQALVQLLGVLHAQD